MPVRDLIRGLGGALLGFLATLILVLCLAETEERFGRSTRGLWWLPGKSWSPHFSPLWHPLLVHGAMNMFVGYLLAGKLTTKRSVLYALVGALVALGLAWLLQSPLPRLYGQAGHNTVLLINLFFALAGGYAAVSVAGKLDH